MSRPFYSSGPNNASAYIASGRPWITGSGVNNDELSLGMASISHGWNDGASSSFQAGMFRTDGEGTAASPAEVYVKFPYVTKAFQVIQSGSGTIRIHFRSIYGNAGNQSPSGSAIVRGNHFIQLDGDEESFKCNVKCKEVYISAYDQTAGFQLFAELTGIPTGSMHQHTGSGVTE